MKKKGTQVQRLFLFFLFFFLCLVGRSRADVHYEGAFITIASFYGPGLYGRRMASGAILQRNKMLVAHKTLPLRSCVRVTCLESGKSAIAPVLDRGPYIRGRGIDLSYKVMETIGGRNGLKRGLRRVLVEPVASRECFPQEQ